MQVPLVAMYNAERPGVAGFELSVIISTFLVSSDFSPYSTIADISDFVTIGSIIISPEDSFLASIDCSVSR